MNCENKIDNETKVVPNGNCQWSDQSLIGYLPIIY